MCNSLPPLSARGSRGSLRTPPAILVKPNPPCFRTSKAKARHRIEVFPSTMGNLLLGIWRDVLGSLRTFSSNSGDGTLHLWASPNRDSARLRRWCSFFPDHAVFEQLRVCCGLASWPHHFIQAREDTKCDGRTDRFRLASHSGRINTQLHQNSRPLLNASGVKGLPGHQAFAIAR